jgi:GTP cyclohydrolase IA
MSETNKYQVGWSEVFKRICCLPEGVAYGVPRGGAIVAAIRSKTIVDNPNDADFILDDIIDSGATMKRYEKYGKPFHALFDKTKEKNYRNVWVEFPWETNEGTTRDIQDTIIRQIEYIGEDASRDGLKDTPKRVMRSWGEIYSGYHCDPKAIINKVFSVKYNNMVVLKDIEFYSTCEHHLMPFVGKCHVAYIPDGKVIGISKLARLVECFSRRMQIQERIGEQVVDTIDEVLHPKGVACIIEARHFCMCSRGVNKQNSIMATSSLRGVFLEDINARTEMLRLIK